ncbi:hypothetical protein SE18_10915 [Herpetosiphon geysericola]|uniref:Uncharacterized protein n=1 Tax=Herpetosiphon geysericola TaxID=70996 RepID=A0A0P6YQW8_9CHLR|nr:hypothetical protein SE18_10915 [Herpetosiphon geysericola]
MGMIWCETLNTDLGINGYLEIILHGAPIGLITLQIMKEFYSDGSKLTFNFQIVLHSWCGRVTRRHVMD